MPIASRPDHIPACAFASVAIPRYLAGVNKYSPIISEFGSAEEEAAYNEWFRKKVEASLADTRPPVPHDQVMAEVRAIIDRAKERGAKKGRSEHPGKEC